MKVALVVVAALASLAPRPAAADGVVLNRWPANVPFPSASIPLEPRVRPARAKRIVKPEPQAGAAEVKVLPPPIQGILPEQGADTVPEPVVTINIGEPDIDRRVVGIAFVDASGQQSICSGLYIDALHVLTAKHCTCHHNSYLVTNDTEMFPSKPSWTQAHLEPGFQGGKRCSTLSDFDTDEGNDIAILTLDGVLESARESRTDACYSIVKNIELLDVWRKEKPRKAVIAGFGSTTENGLVVGKRNKASVPINSTDCASHTTQSLGCVTYREMVMGLRPKGIYVSDACRGDSGGPAYLIRNDRIVPVGIISRAVSISSGALCGAGGIYTLLGRTDVISWLNKRLPVKNDPGCSQAIEPRQAGAILSRSE